MLRAAMSDGPEGVLVDASDAGERVRARGWGCWVADGAVVGVVRPSTRAGGLACVCVCVVPLPVCACGILGPCLLKGPGRDGSPDVRAAVIVVVVVVAVDGVGIPV